MSSASASKAVFIGQCARLEPAGDEGAVWDRQAKVEHWHQDALHQATVLLVGAGGIGSAIAPALVRMGVKGLFLVDPDVVSLSNLSRQAFVKEDLGRPKASALAQHLVHQGALGTVVVGAPMAFCNFVKAYPAVVPTVVVAGPDNNAARCEASQYCLLHHLPLVCLGIAVDATMAYVAVQEPGKACLGCILGQHLLTGTRSPCPGTPAVADVILTVAGFAVYALTSLLMPRPRAWTITDVSMATGTATSRHVSIQHHCPLCRGKGG